MDQQPIQEIVKLQQTVANTKLHDDLREKINLMLQRSESALKYSGKSDTLDSVEQYINQVIRIPWFTQTTDNLDLDRAAQILQKNHHGLKKLKQRILEYIAVMKLKQKQQNSEGLMRAPILCFVGLVGTGKTTIAYSIAQAMGRKLVRIPFGGMGSALDLRGQSRQHTEAEPGHVIKALQQAGSNNPVILLDEIDRVSEEAHTDIMGVLVELLDPEQNAAFTDHYIDYPVNLSDVLFIATANNTKGISTAVMDRLEPIQMPSYSDAEKITIGKDYVLAQVMQASGLKPGQLVIDDSVWPNIVRPLGYDAGIRTLKRTISSISRKAAKLIIEGSTTSVHVTPENIKQFVPQV